VGSGCGAVTRALGEAGARVVALEGSLGRARITAARCRGLQGVDVVCDDFRDFRPPAAFDVVLMVGVLEYAPAYFGGDDPVGAALAKARECLVAGGALVVAIENQLGLKYFAGASEDHHGQAFFGLEGRYAETTGPRTFGRQELRRRLAQAGLPEQAWYYPFPDYKLPRLLLTEEGLRDARLPAGQLAGGPTSRDYVWPHPALFAEDLVWEVLGENGLIADLANSFLVAASADAASSLLRAPAWLAELRTPNRVRAYRTVTHFVDGGAGILVRKSRADESASAPAEAPVRLLTPEPSPLLPGRPLAARARRLLRTPGVDAAGFAAVLAPWAGGRGGPGGPATGLTPFDLEWEYVPELTLEHVMLRGLLSLFVEGRGRTLPDGDLTIGDLIAVVSGRLGTPAAAGLAADLIEREAAVQSVVFGMDERETGERLRAQLAEPFAAPPALDAAIGARDARIQDLLHVIAERDALLAERDARVAGLEARAGDLSAQIDAIARSSSWRLTAPLRRLKRGAS
jgi:SAM-dependent methyltransferase